MITQDVIDTEIGYTCSECSRVHDLGESCPEQLLCLSKLLKNISIIPLGDRILVLPDPSKESIKSDSGTGYITIHIPETAQATPSIGSVIAVGPEVKRVKTGMRILYGKYSGVNYYSGVKPDLRVMREEEVMCQLISLKDLNQNMSFDQPSTVPQAK